MTKEELKEWRKSLGMTQEQLSEFLGYKRGTLIKWEQGVTEVPSFMDLIKLLLKKKHLRRINETARKALSNRGNVPQGKAVSGDRQKAGIKGVRVKKLSGKDRAV